MTHCISAQLKQHILDITNNVADTCINENYDIPIYTPKSNIYNNKTILVISGGGVKGIAMLGALKYLENNKTEYFLFLFLLLFNIIYL